MHYLEQTETLLQAVLESFIDGVLVLTADQEILYINSIAHSIFLQLPLGESKRLPAEIERVCLAMLESRELYPHPVAIESELTTPTTTFRIRGQWLQLETAPRPCLLLRLQDQTESVQGLAIAEAQQWGLTPRETEVWLLRRAGSLRKEIAATLCISLDTVKKHLKNIQTKRQIALDEAEWQAEAS